MRSQGPVPPVRDLVLVGGGHTHVHVLRCFAMRPLPGVRITLVSREVHTPYSGMLPGHVAGHYDYDDVHIDLGPLTLAAGARLIAEEVIGLDLAAGRVEFARHPPVRFDVASLNCGAAPGFGHLPMPPSAIPVKPIGRFLPRWHALRAVLGQRASGDALQIVIVGGGAGGVELALAAHHALVTGNAAVKITLVTAGTHVLEGHNRRVQRRFDGLLRARGVDVATGFNVAHVDVRGVTDADGREVRGDFVLWVTGVEAPAWLRSSGLALDADGFVAVDQQLRSVSDARVFAAGDVAAMIDQPRPKSGVFAVRQGPVLAENLRRQLLRQPLRKYRAQRRVLALISEGGRGATASRGRWFAHGALMWRWKDRIDRRFMAMYQHVEPMQPVAPDVANAFVDELPDPMRCGGCGAKLGADVLARIFDRLRVPVHPRLPVGIGDDAAVFETTARQVVLTADSLRNMLDDPYEFGRIGARHALNDVYAMGATPIAALALVTVPLMGAAQMEDELFQVMRGALDVLTEEGVALAGGHSSEGLELSLGFAIVGDVDAQPLRKDALVPGDALVLTRRIGSGVLLAAKARRVARTRWLRDAVVRMDTSNRECARLLRKHGARACTDVTGFGLIGHLSEMLRASKVGAEVDASVVPFYDGAVAMAEAGVTSSLQSDNEQALRDFSIEGTDLRDVRIRLLVDPQTAGGLLAGVPAESADNCVASLHAAGYTDATIVGRVIAAGDRRGVIRCEP